MSSDSASVDGGQNHFEIIAIAALALIAVFFVVIPMLPVLLLGLLMGAAFAAAFDKSESHRFAYEVILLSFLMFVYLIGIPTHGSRLNGVLFSDFSDFTKFVSLKAISIFNHLLPRKLKSLSTSVFKVQVYLWIPFFIALVSSFGLSRFSERKAPLFKMFRFLFDALPDNPKVVLKFMVSTSLILLINDLIFGLPNFISLFNYIILIPFGIILLIGKTKIDLRVFPNSPILKTKLRDSILVGSEKSVRRREINLTTSMLNHHVQIVGASGFGKSVLLSHIIRSRIESGSGILFIDLKADFETIRQVVSIAHSCNRLNDFQIFSCGNPEISNSYNVLASGSANQLKDRIMGAFVWSEEFYKNEAESFLLRILRVLTHLRDKSCEQFDLKTILDLANDIELLKLRISQIAIEERELIDQTTQLAEYLSNPENRKSLRGLKSQIESLIFSDFGALLRASSDGIDLFNAVQSKKIVFVLLDSRTYGQSAASLGKLIIQDLKAMSARIDNEISRIDRIPFTVVIDEFADLATEDFVGFLDRARSSKIGVVVSHQEVADLDKVSPEFTRRLMNSTSTIFSFLQKLPDSSELIAGVSGTKKVEEVTEQAERTIFGNQRTGMRSIKVVDEFNIHPNVLRSLQVGECVMIGKYPEATSKIITVRREMVSDYLSDLKVKDLLNRKVKTVASDTSRFESSPEERVKF